MSFRLLMVGMGAPPHPDLDYLAWQVLLETMGAALVFFVLLFTVLIVGWYALWTRRIKIRRPSDLFRPYTPMSLLLISFACGLGLLILFWVEFSDLFPGSPVSPWGPGMQVALYGTVATAVLAYLLMLAPGVTPRNLRYRPRASFWPMRLSLRT